MKITLNLATRPYADQGPALKQLRIGMLVLVVVLIGLGLFEMHFHQSALKMRAHEDAVDQSISRIRREQLGYQAQMQQPPNARVLTQAQFLNHLFDEKSFSWTACMEDLERVLPGGVQVTAIEPSRGKDGRLTLKLRISGQRERSVEMVRNMEHSQRFVAPRITGENAENGSQGDLQQVRDTGKVSFDVLAEYNPPSLEERKAEIARQKRPRTTPSASRPAVNPGRPQYVPPNPQPGVQRQPQAMYPGIRGGVPPGAMPMHGNRPVNSTVPNANGGPQ